MRNVEPGLGRRDLRVRRVQFEDGGTVTATSKCQYGIFSGRGTWTREGALVMNYPDDVCTWTVARRGGKWRIEGHFRRSDGRDDGPQWEEYAPLEAPGNPLAAPTDTCCCTIA